MAYSVKLYFNTEEIDISDLVIAIKKDESLYKALKPNTNTVGLTVKKDTALFTKLLGWADDVACTILKDGQPYFKGYLSPTYENVIQKFSGLKNMTLQIEDVGIRSLQRVIRSSFLYIGNTVSNPSSTGTSIVHKLLALAGVTSYSLPEIALSIPYYYYSYADKKTYWELLETLLFESGYTFYFDESGTFRVFKWSEASIDGVATWDSANYLKESLSIKKTREDYSKITLKWTPLEYKENIVLVEDTSGGNETNSCNIEVAAGDAYPEDSDTETVFVDYSSETETIKCAVSASLDVAQTGLTLLTDVVNYGTKARYSYKNNGGSAGYITRLKILGNAYVVKTENESTIEVQEIAGRDDKEYEYSPQHLFTNETINTFINGLANYYRYSDAKVSFVSSESVALGTILKITDSVFTGSVVYVRVIQKVEDSGQGVFAYQAEAIGEYSTSEIDAEIITAKPVSSPAVLPSDVGTVVEGYIGNSGIIQDVIVGSDWTETPTIPTVSYIAQVNAILIKWDRQTNLSNLCGYQIQVSEDAANWYALSFDRSDYKTGSLDGFTEWQSEQCIHTLPLADGITASYYYRVRRVTRGGGYSSWSAAIIGSTTLLDNGAFSANEVYSNLVSATAIQTAIAQVSDSITIDSEGFKGTTYDVTKDVYTPIGARRSYLDKDEFTIERFDYSGNTGFAYISDLPNYAKGVHYAYPEKGTTFIYNGKLWLGISYSVPKYSFYIFERSKTGSWKYIKSISIDEIPYNAIPTAVLQGNNLFITAGSDNIIRNYIINPVDDTISFSGHSYTFAYARQYNLVSMGTNKLFYYSDYASSITDLGVLTYNSSTGFTATASTTTNTYWLKSLVLNSSDIALSVQNGYWKVYMTSSNTLYTSSLTADSSGYCAPLLLEQNKFIEFGNNPDNSVYFYTWNGSALTRGTQIVLSEGETEFGSFTGSASTAYLESDGCIGILTRGTVTYAPTYPYFKYRRWQPSITSNTMTLVESKSYDISSYFTEAESDDLISIRNGSIYYLLGNVGTVTKGFVLGKLPEWQTDLVVGGGSSQIRATSIKPNGSSYTARGTNISSAAPTSSDGVNGDIWIVI